MYQKHCKVFWKTFGYVVAITSVKWAPSSEFVSSSIPSWQILTAHAQPFRGARDLAFCLKVPLDSLLLWASSEGSGETARMRRLAWTFAARIGYKYQIRLTRSKWCRSPRIRHTSHIPCIFIHKVGTFMILNVILRHFIQELKFDFLTFIGWWSQWAELKFHDAQSASCRILATTTGFITRWTSKNQILTFIFTL